MNVMGATVDLSRYTRTVRVYRPTPQPEPLPAWGDDVLWNVAPTALNKIISGLVLGSVGKGSRDKYERMARFYLEVNPRRKTSGIKEQDILKMLAACEERQAAPGTVDSLKAALSFYAAANNLPFEWQGERIQRAYDGLKKRVHSKKPPTSKAPALAATVVKEMMHRVLDETGGFDEKLGLGTIRGAFALVLQFFLIGRMEDLRRLVAADFKQGVDNDGNDIITVRFNTSKTDVYFRGAEGTLTSTGGRADPVKFTTKYFARMGLRFSNDEDDDNLDYNSVFGCIRRRGGASIHDGKKPVANNQIMKGLKKALAAVGYTARVTTTSGKRGAVTHAFKRKMTDKQIMIAGRWRSQDTALRYTCGLPAYREEAVRLMSLDDDVEMPPQQLQPGGTEPDQSASLGTIDNEVCDEDEDDIDDEDDVVDEGDVEDGDREDMTNRVIMLDEEGNWQMF